MATVSRPAALTQALAELTALLDRVEAIENTAQNEERSVLWRRISRLVAAISRRHLVGAPPADPSAPPPVPRTGGAPPSAARRWGAGWRGGHAPGPARPG